MPALHLLIAGRVQGVGFRAFVAEVARGAGASGWVRSLADGRVEAVIAGEERVIDAVVAACRRGPPGGRVDRIDEAAVDMPHNDGFSILPTA